MGSENKLGIKSHFDSFDQRHCFHLAFPVEKPDISVAL